MANGERSGRSVPRPARLAALAFPLLIGALATSCGGSSATATSAPTVAVSGTAHGWVFSDGQTVKVSMGPNQRFKPLSHVNIVQCSDPGGKPANLPTKFIECDENTIQGDTVVVQADGSFSEPAYTVYQLPSAALGEAKDTLPHCNQTNQCVLLISEYQTDLTKPKVFSHPFTVLPARGVGS